MTITHNMHNIIHNIVQLLTRFQCIAGVLCIITVLLPINTRIIMISTPRGSRRRPQSPGAASGAGSGGPRAGPGQDVTV